MRAFYTTFDLKNGRIGSFDCQSDVWLPLKSAKCWARKSPRGRVQSRPSESCSLPSQTLLGGVVMIGVVSRVTMVVNLQLGYSISLLITIPVPPSSSVSPLHQKEGTTNLAPNFVTIPSGQLSKRSSHKFQIARKPQYVLYLHTVVTSSRFFISNTAYNIKASIIIDMMSRLGIFDQNIGSYQGPYITLQLQVYPSMYISNTYFEAETTQATPSRVPSGVAAVEAQALPGATCRHFPGTRSALQTPSPCSGSRSGQSVPKESKASKRSTGSQPNDGSLLVLEPFRAPKHKDLRHHGFWNPPCAKAQSVGSLS